MHKNVLIPTDFQIVSLNIIKKVISDLNENDTVTITLLHGYLLSENITDLLFYSRKEILNQIVPPNFIEGCSLLKNKFTSQVVQINIDLFHGLTKRTFESFVTSNNIQSIYIPIGLNYKRATKKSYDLIPYISKCGDNISYVHFESSQDESLESFSDLFLDNIKFT